MTRPLLTIGLACGLLAGAMSCAKADSTNTAAATEQGAATATDTTQAPTDTTVKSKEPAAATKSKSKGKSMTVSGTMPVKPAIAPAHVVVQHILIGFAGSVPGKGITRTKEEAKKLAHEILEKARKGADFATLVTKYTDDSPPGIYKMSATGVPPQMGEYSRDQMVPAFGNVGFAISPGNIDIAEYDPKASPFGWHIIKRLQ